MIHTVNMTFSYWQKLSFLCLWSIFGTFIVFFSHHFRLPDKGSITLVESRGELSGLDLVSWLQWKMPSAPVLFWKEKERGRGRSRCGEFPSILDVHYNNRHWQETRTSQGMFYLYSAYLDTRATIPEGPSIRILGMIDLPQDPTLTMFCQLWFENTPEPLVSEVYEFRQVFTFNILPKPFLLSCEVPESHRDRVPSSVSLVEERCATATTNLKVIYNPLKESEAKEGFAVCTKGLDFPNDNSPKLAEWIELLAALGASKISFYDLGVNRNVSRLLKHYSRQGKVDLRSFSLAGHQPNLPGLTHLYLKAYIGVNMQSELVPYNDCFYRNMYRYGCWYGC